MAIDRGKSNRAVVQALINDMTKFSEYVRNEVMTMINQTDQLADSWDDPQYVQFSNFIYDLAESIGKDMSVFEEATSALQKKLDMYSD